MFNCKWAHGVLGAIILIVTLWPGIVGVTASKWVVVVAAVIVVLHSCFCRNCSCMMHGEMPKKRKR